MWRFLKDHHDQIGSTTALLGLVVGIGGFALTIQQLQSTAQALRASNTYQVQKDARELVDKVRADERFRAAMQAGVLPENDSAVLENLWKMFNFYVSVFRQSEADGLSPQFVASFRRDFCAFVQKPLVAQGWDRLRAADQLGADQEEMRRRWCP
ncbi:hypothetical protein [Siccirubricoccus deserti]|uniref:Uncharacterized protein n=1 Tax=Siccirubricoccus deserti TaxID=2013562 RepID=A0A9X0UF54_9PROT|nr:hypothetical protein [Siccirubricoccus deserti]MBC4017576.1 hypothetical protein [Siccirubricoccus deserti]